MKTKLDAGFSLYQAAQVTGLLLDLQCNFRVLWAFLSILLTLTLASGTWPLFILNYCLVNLKMILRNRKWLSLRENYFYYSLRHQNGFRSHVSSKCLVCRLFCKVQISMPLCKNIVADNQS